MTQSRSVPAGIFLSPSSVSKDRTNPCFTLAIFPSPIREMACSLSGVRLSRLGTGSVSEEQRVRAGGLGSAL